MTGSANTTATRIATARRAVSARAATSICIGRGRHHKARGGLECPGRLHVRHRASPPNSADCSWRSGARGRAPQRAGLRGREVGPLPAGIGFALLSALLFGLSTPCAKLLLGGIPPLLLAGLLYAGSGLGLTALRLVLPASTGDARLTRADWPWLAGAVFAGGVAGPVLLLWGLRSTLASGASLLLNLEGVFTALIAWFVFHENVDRRIALGFGLIVAGGVALSWSGGGGGAGLSPGTVSIAAACLAWGIDNNLT